MERAAIDEARLRREAGPRWQRIAVVAQTESTNADLLADAAAPDGSVLVAEFQAAGRGRLERVWTSPPRAGLTFSVLLRPRVPVAAWGWLPLLAGVAVREAVIRATGVDAVLKWPNDVLAGPERRKIAGILAQTGGGVQARQAGVACVLGCGLNVTTTEAELPVAGAGSLVLAGATAPDRTGLLIATLDRLDAWLRRFEAAGGDADATGLRTAYRDACVTLGAAVVVHGLDGTALRGQAIDVEPDGRLRVRVGSGVQAAEHVVGAGDVEHVRPEQS